MSVVVASLVGIYHFHLRWCDNLRASNDVNILLLCSKYQYLVTGLEAVEIAEYFTKNIIVRREDHVAGLTWIG